MPRQLHEKGYEVIKSAISIDEISNYRIEAQRIAGLKGSICVRNVCRSSETFSVLAKSLGKRFAGDRKCVRSLLFDKTEEQNWPVAWHQDLTIAVKKRRDVPGYGPWSIKDGIHCVQPPIEILESVVTVRVHLDDTPQENGALRVVGGTHKLGRVDSNAIAKHSRRAVTCDCRAGDVLLMSPLILHSSNRATIPKHRRVLHFEYAEVAMLAEGLDWNYSI